MRGARFGGIADVVQARIIPADAGSTAKVFRSASQLGDHPRGCGEHHGDMAEDIVAGGSSPRMRGALSPSRRYTFMGRIIPADAGST